MNNKISFYDLDLLSQVGIAGGWIAFVIFVMAFISFMFFRIIS